MSSIKITLCSDLCAASGEGYASLIDNDICFDKIGIPFIPARRLKGVLREAAEFIGIDKEIIDGIFGASGNRSSGSLWLENAFLGDADLNYDKMQEELKGYEREKVIGLFTYVRVATAIEAGTGSAQEDTLRFTRVMKHFSPKTKEPFEFWANCTIDPQYEDALFRSCKALRSIGYCQNRGFGAVRCAFETESGKGIQTVKTVGGHVLIPALQEEIRYQIPIYLTNTAPLIISSSKDDETEDYITGTALLGAFAWRYPEKDSERFQELFLNKKVIFSNLYLGGSPVPLCYARLKQARTYINCAKEGRSEFLDNDSPKPLKDSYMDEEGCIVIPQKEVIYHHAKKPKPRLYMQTALSTGQCFAGSIQGKGKDLCEILKLLENNPTLHIGKSKSAQYANCLVTRGEAVPVKERKLEVRNEVIAICLQSEVILFENGINTCDYLDLMMALQLPGIHTREESKNSCDMEKSFVMFKTVMGYSGIWNLKKTHSKAFKAGSVLFVKNVTGVLERDYYIGAKVNEGFGHCKVMLLNEMPMVRKDKHGISKSQNNGSYAEIIKKTEKRSEIMEKAICHAKNNQDRLPPSLISDSQIGRVRLMLKQSGNREDLKKRIDAIKTPSVEEIFSTYFASADAHCDALAEVVYEDYRLYWDTVLRWHRYQRKIDEQKKRRGAAK